MLRTKIGYACLNVNIKDANFKTCRLNNVTDEKILALINHNLNSLESLIDYNKENNIKLFRISSGLIPYGSNKVNTIDWEKVFKDRFSEIGHKIKDNNIRITMHPGQYTVLNSPNHKVIENSINDILYHLKVIKLLGGDTTNKIIIHVGGAYGDKSVAIERFVDRYISLDNDIKKYLVIENDDKIFNIEDVLYINKKTGCPVVFDNLHNFINPALSKKYKGVKEEEWISIASETWNNFDGRQKIHYSQQNTEKNPGAHSDTIDEYEFIKFYNKIRNKDIDIMLEVKDKNNSAIKCIERLYKIEKP